jgi:hypothetical protein
MELVWHPINQGNIFMNIKHFHCPLDKLKAVKPRMPDNMTFYFIEFATFVIFFARLVHFQGERGVVNKSTLCTLVTAPYIAQGFHIVAVHVCRLDERQILSPIFRPCLEMASMTKSQHAEAGRAFAIQGLGSKSSLNLLSSVCWVSKTTVVDPGQAHELMMASVSSLKLYVCSLWRTSPNYSTSMLMLCVLPLLIGTSRPRPPLSKKS